MKEMYRLKQEIQEANDLVRLIERKLYDERPSFEGKITEIRAKDSESKSICSKSLNGYLPRNPLFRKE